jgi:hypothetical protein
MDNIPDADNNIQLLRIIKKYKDEARRGFIDNTLYLITRDEFALEKGEDYYDVRVAFEKEYLEIFNSLLPDERKACHKICLFENDILLDEGKYYTIDYDKWIIHIHKGEINKIQMIEVYVNVDLLNIFLGRQKRHDRIKEKNNE